MVGRANIFCHHQIVFLIHCNSTTKRYVEEKKTIRFLYYILVLCLGTVTRKGINHGFKMSCSKNTNQPSISRCLAFLYNISDLLQPQLQNTVKIIILEIHALFTSSNCLMTVTLLLFGLNLIKSEK